MTIYLKHNSDAGTPTIGTAAGGFIPIFDYLLVTLMGWTKPYTATNLAVYKQPSGSNGFYLRIDDTGASYARVRGYETMSDVNTGTGLFPTDTQVSGGFYMHRPTSTGYPWRFISNGKFFWLNWQYSFDLYTHDLLFGDFVSYKPGDVYNTMIQCSPFSSTATPSYVQYSAPGVVSPISGYNVYFARSFTQIGGSVEGAKFTDNSNGANATSAYVIGSAGPIYPSAADGTLRLAPLWLCEASNIGRSYNTIRGYIPGLWAPLHARPLLNYDVFTGTAGLINGRSFEVWDQPINNSATRWQVFVETSDTWGGL